MREGSDGVRSSICSCMKWPFIFGILVCIAIIGLCLAGPSLTEHSRYCATLEVRKAIEEGVIDRDAYNAWASRSGARAIAPVVEGVVPEVHFLDARTVSDRFTTYFGLERYAFRAIGFIAFLQGCVCAYWLFARNTKAVSTPHTT